MCSKWLFLFPNVSFTTRDWASALLSLHSVELLLLFRSFFSIVFVSFCSLRTSFFSPKLAEINFALERSSAFLTGSYGFTLPHIWNKSSFGKLRSFTEPRSASRSPCVIKMWVSEMLSQEDLECYSVLTCPGKQYGFGMWLNEMSLDIKLFFLLQYFLMQGGNLQNTWCVSKACSGTSGFIWHLRASVLSGFSCKPLRVHLALLRLTALGQMFLWKWPAVCVSSYLHTRQLGKMFAGSL